MSNETEKNKPLSQSGSGSSTCSVCSLCEGKGYYWDYSHPLTGSDKRKFKCGCTMGHEVYSPAAHAIQEDVTISIPLLKRLIADAKTAWVQNEDVDESLNEAREKYIREAMSLLPNV